jgi:hypothetical protein
LRSGFRPAAAASRTLMPHIQPEGSLLHDNLLLAT